MAISGFTHCELCGEGGKIPEEIKKYDVEIISQNGFFRMNAFYLHDGCYHVLSGILDKFVCSKLLRKAKRSSFERRKKEWRVH